MRPINGSKFWDNAIVQGHIFINNKYLVTALSMPSAKYVF